MTDQCSREYLELKLLSIEEKQTIRLKAAQDLVAQQFKTNDAKIELQNKNNDTHFAALNGEAGRLKEFLATTVSKGTWEIQHKALTDRVDKLEIAISRQLGLQVGIGAVAILILGLLLAHIFAGG